MRGAPLSLARSLPPSLFGLTVDAVRICGSTEPSRAEPSGAGRGRRSWREAAAQVLLPHPVIRHFNRKVKTGRVPGVVCRQQCACPNSEGSLRGRACARTHARTSARLGHQRSSHRAILSRTESKDILDCGSKSQQAKEGRQGVCCILSPGDQPRRHLFPRNCWILRWHGVSVHFLLRWSLKMAM